MRRAVNTLVFVDLLFVLFLAVSAFFDGVSSDVFYLVGFALPIFAALTLNKGRLAPPLAPLKRRDAFFVLPMIPVTVALVMGLSALTSLLLGAFGLESSTALKGGFFEAVLRYAVLTSVLEEILFRYLPMRIAAQYSPRATVFLSALLFSLVHADLFQFPYAFAAGVIFIAMDMATKSVIPSIVAHFLNNLLAVTFYFYSQSVVLVSVCIALLGILALAGVALIAVKRKAYADRFSSAFVKGNVKRDDFFSVLLLAVPMIAIAIISLIS